MKQTRISKLLGIPYPILQGGMLWIATAKLASAVSDSGGLGVISPLAGMAEDDEPTKNMTRQIYKTRSLTNKPFGVNIPLDLDYVGNLIAKILDDPIDIVITAAGDPGHFTDVLKKSGKRVLHVVSTVSQALRAEESGVDGVIAEGIEAAAHNGENEIPLFSLIPQVVDAVSIPVIAAGGIVDARGFVAARVLGAEGVQLGTRFVAVEENIAHHNYKEAILSAKDTDTIITCRGLIPTRSLRTPFSVRLLEMERSSKNTEEISAYLGYRRNRIAQIEGDLSKGEAYCGASAGIIRQVLPARRVIEQLVDGYDQIIKKITKIKD